RLEDTGGFSGALAFSAHGRRLLGAGGRVCLWDPAGGKPMWSEDKRDSRTDLVRHAVLSADGPGGVGAGEPPPAHSNAPDGTRAYFQPPSRLFRWDMPAPMPVPVAANAADAQQLALGIDGTRLLIASWEAPGLVVLELPSGREVARHLDPARTAALSPD